MKSRSFEKGKPQGLEFLRLVSPPGAPGTPRTESPGAAACHARDHDPARNAGCFGLRFGAVSRRCGGCVRDSPRIDSLLGSPGHRLHGPRTGRAGNPADARGPRSRGLQIRQPFTEDVETFTAAIEALKPSSGQRRGEPRRPRGGRQPQLRRRHSRRQRTTHSYPGQGLPSKLKAGNHGSTRGARGAQPPPGLGSRPQAPDLLLARLRDAAFGHGRRDHRQRLWRGWRRTRHVRRLHRTRRP
jgi:hypothetical protein